MEIQHRLLIVDDVPTNIQVAASMLATSGYQMAFATDGASALKMAREQPPDLVLLDIMMPGMNGFQVCAQLKRMEETRGIPVIFLTAKTDVDSVVQGFNVGGVDYLTKPFQGAELQARIRNHLRLREAEKQLQALNAAKDKFLSIISHDLRGPMGSLRDMLSMLKSDHAGFSTAELGQWLDIAANQSEQFYKLLENLLSWARLQRGAMAHRPQRLDLFVVVYEVFFLFEGVARDKGITLTNHVPEPLEGYADRDMIHTVLRNLVSNALKFTTSGGTVEVSAQVLEEAIEITVRDDGTGIEPADQAKLFRLDTPHKKTGTAGEKGTGMGLLLVKDLVEKNGGELRLESEPGQGSRFIFTLDPAEAA